MIFNSYLYTHILTVALLVKKQAKPYIFLIFKISVNLLRVV
jgi:hypothetical protein